jgi:hypothetical protein
MAHALDPVHTRARARSGPRATIAHGLAVMVLVVSILPVVLAGPSLLRAPVKLERELRANVERLLHSGGRSRAHFQPAAGTGAFARGARR